MPCCASAAPRPAPTTWSRPAAGSARRSSPRSRRFPSVSAKQGSLATLGMTGSFVIPSAARDPSLSERLLVWPQIDLMRPGAALLGVEVPVVVDDRLDLEQAVGADLLGAAGHA